MPSWLEQEQPTLQFSRKVSGTRMFWETKEFGPARRKTTFASSSPLTRHAVRSLLAMPRAEKIGAPAPTAGARPCWNRT
jgi:hypothetical protein